MRFAFHKMHGLGNDFVVIDARTQDVAITRDRARAIADRHIGIGCDQLILLQPSTSADLRMRIFNADGGEAEQCGNALRCVASLTGVARIETTGGIVDAQPLGGGVSIDLGSPRFGWDEIPLAYPLDTASLPVAWGPLEGGSAVNVGNPHLVFFVADLDAVPLRDLGPEIEHDALFPSRVNVNVAEVTGPSALRRALVTSPVTVSLPGGELEIDWAPGGSIRMTGGATHVFSGEAELEAFG
jgi:diaminopimelate epimerase